jgi:hypothetical protein
MRRAPNSPEHSPTTPVCPLSRMASQIRRCSVRVVRQLNCDMGEVLKTTTLKVAVVFCLLLPVIGASGQFVDLTAQVEAFDWSYFFLVDHNDRLTRSPEQSGSSFKVPMQVHCVIGTNSWFMERSYGGCYSNQESQAWFTGTKLVSAEKIIRIFTNDQGIVSQPGFTDVKIWPSFDGNPGRPIKQQDFFMVDQYVPWIAFCSGPALKTKGHYLCPPSDVWKEEVNAPKGFKDETTLFPDGLGLPASLTLIATTTQPIFQYRAHLTTNMLGWSFPLEFYMVQYEPDDTNGWVASFTARGRITAIGPGIRPQIPESVLNAVNNRK